MTATTSTKETAALDSLTARLPYGPTRAMLDLVHVAAYTLGNKAARRWCQQLVRENRPLPHQPKEGELDADGIRLEGDVHVALTELWGDCEALLRSMYGMAAVAQEPGRELAPVSVPSNPMRTHVDDVAATTVQRTDRYQHINVGALARWAEEHGDTEPGWMDRAQAALEAERRGAEDETQPIRVDGAP
jgi:hypothetical protein